MRRFILPYILCINVLSDAGQIIISNAALKNYTEPSDKNDQIEWKTRSIDLEKADNVTTFVYAAKVPENGSYIKCVRSELEDGEWANSICDESWTQLDKNDMIRGVVEKDSRNYADHAQQTMMAMILGKIQNENEQYRYIRSEEWTFTWTKDSLTKKRSLFKMWKHWFMQYFLVIVVTVIMSGIVLAICCCPSGAGDEDDFILEVPPRSTV